MSNRSGLLLLLACVLSCKDGSTPTTLTPVPVATVTVSPATTSLAAGTTQQFTAVLADVSAGTLTGRTVNWSSSAPSVATVSTTGLVTGVAGGTTTITATSEGKSGSASVTVTVVIPVVTIFPTTLWSGGTILLRSDAFRTGGTGATLQVGGMGEDLTRVDDSTMTARIPNTVSGTIMATAVVNGVPANLTALTVYGFAETVNYSPQLGEDVYVWPRDGHARIMGGSGEDGPNPGLALIDLDTRAVTSFPGILNTNNLRGPGATFQDSIFLLKNSLNGLNGPVEVWRLLPTPTLLESHPEIRTSRQAMRFGPNAWFTSQSNLISYPGGELTFANEPEGVFMSPRHDRATITVDNIPTGVPVFNVPDGTLAYAVPQLTSAQGVDFSPDGALLAIAGGRTGRPEGPGRILLLNAATGTVIRDTTVDRRVFAVAIDPVRPLLFVGLIAADDRPVVLVLDRNSFKTLGELAVPTTAPSCFLGCYKGVIALSNAPALYVFWGYNGASRAYRFTMPVGSGVFGP